MKKIKITILVLLVCTFIGLSFFTSSKSSKKYEKIKIAEVTHSVFYAPLYVSIENGYFSNEGLDIELILTSGADKVSAAVLSGDAQIGFAGAESAIYIYQKENGDYLQIFSGLTKRDGQFIVGKDKRNFSLTNLYGKEILVGRKTGMPALNFLNALEKNNIDISKININYSIDFASLTGAFIGGTGDYVNLFEPNVTSLEKEGYGYSLISIGKLSGEMPYTTFYAKKSFLEENPKLINKFRKAIDKGLNFVMDNDSYTIAKAIQNQFPNTALNDLSTIIKRYKDCDSWLDSHVINEEIFNNLEDLLIKNDLLDKKIDFDRIIIN